VKRVQKAIGKKGGAGKNQRYFISLRDFWEIFFLPDLTSMGPFLTSLLLPLQLCLLALQRRAALEPVSAPSWL
jgi:hypothetical protein